MEEKLDATKFFSYYETYRRIAYSAMVRGVEIKMVTHWNQIKDNPEMRRAGMISLMSYKYKRIFSEPMLISLMMEDTCKSIIDEIGDRTPGDLGLKEMYRVEGEKQDVVVYTIPTVKYTTLLDVDLASERDAYERYSYGSISLQGWGNIIQITKTPVEDTLCDEIVDVQYDVVEEGQMIEQIMTSEEGEQQAFFIVPPMENIISKVGDIEEIDITVTVKCPGYEDVVHETVPEVSIIPLTYKHVCNVVFDYKVGFSEVCVTQRTNDHNLMMLDKNMRREIKCLFNIVQKKIQAKKRLMQGNSRLSRNLEYILMNSKFPYRMPTVHNFKLLVAIAMDIEIVWHEYPSVLLDWRDEVYDYYRLNGSYWTGLYSFLDFEIEGDPVVPWGNKCKYNDIEEFFCYSAHYTSGFRFVDFGRENYALQDLLRAEENGDREGEESDWRDEELIAFMSDALIPVDGNTIVEEVVAGEDMPDLIVPPNLDNDIDENRPEEFVEDINGMNDPD